MEAGYTVRNELLASASDMKSRENAMWCATTAHTICISTQAPTGRFYRKVQGENGRERVHAGYS